MSFVVHFKMFVLFILLIIILLISCADKETTVINTKVFSLELKNKWKKEYYGDSILLEKSGEQLLFQMHYHQYKFNESEIQNALLQLIETYRKTEMQKSGDIDIGENNYGDSNGIYFVRFIGNEKNNRYFTVFIFGTTGYLLSVYFEKIKTTQSEFEKRARGIINKIVLNQ